MLLAGGIGITPIYCMVKRLIELKRPWQLHYSSPLARGCRVPRRAVAIRQTAASISTTRPPANSSRLPTSSRTRRRPRISIAAGPGPMLAAFEAATANWPPEQIHVEYFTPKFAAAAGRRLRRRARAFQARAHHSARQVDPAGGARSRYPGAAFLRGRRVRRLRDARDLRHSRPPRLDPDRERAQRERDHDDLLLGLEVAEARARYLMDQTNDTTEGLDAVRPVAPARCVRGIGCARPPEAEGRGHRRAAAIGRRPDRGPRGHGEARHRRARGGAPRHLGTTAIELAGPADIIVVEQHANREAGSWGGLLSLGASVRGVAGVIVRRTRARHR